MSLFGNKESVKGKKSLVIYFSRAYEVIYIGSPIYWGTMPMSMFTRVRKIRFYRKNN